MELRRGRTFLFLWCVLIVWGRGVQAREGDPLPPESRRHHPGAGGGGGAGRINHHHSSAPQQQQQQQQQQRHPQESSASFINVSQKSSHNRIVNNHNALEFSNAGAPVRRKRFIEKIPPREKRKRGKYKNKPRKRKLHIGGLFELSQSTFAANSRSELLAAKMAIQDINAQDYIPGYDLHMYYNDTKGESGVAADAFYDLVYRKKQILMVVGSADSEVTKSLGEVVPYWNLVLVSHAATSPALSKREKFPTFYRLAAADSSHNAARKTFIQYFNWDTVATIHQDLEMFSLAINDMIKDFEKSNITLKATETFRSFGEDLQAKMNQLKKDDARIIIGSFQEDAARHVFCQAYRLGMYGSRYVWMLVGWYSHEWWKRENDTSCTHDELTKAVEGYFAVDTLSAIIGTQKSIANLTTEEFVRRYRRAVRKVGGSDLMSPSATQAYDTIWTIAITLRNAMHYWATNNLSNTTIDQFSYKGAVSEIMRDNFVSIMGNLDFMGVSGPISFDGPDRQGITVLEQNQGGTVARIALFYPENNTLDLKCSGCQSIIWTGGKVPADKYTIKSRVLVILPAVFIPIAATSTLGIVFAVSFLSFNLYHRKLKYIKLSSPKLNNMAVIGCIFVYSAVVLLGFDDTSMKSALQWQVVCSTRAFLFAAGFSLSFGAMFTKTYRVYQIFTRAHSGLVKSKLLKDKQLLFIICALLALDSVLILLWVVIDPMHREIRNFTKEASETDLDLLYIPQLSKCHSRHLDKWMGVFYAFKGLLLIFGVYMAWETRHVKIPALNDSQYIGLNVYNVVIMSVIVVALSSLLSDEPTLAYAIVSSFILLSTTIALCLLFVPKIYAIMTHGGNPVIASAGLTVEANTRRFATDEKKELLYRAEVQNRVYKRELVELEQEVNRLQRLIEIPLQPYAHMNDDIMYLLPESKVDCTPVSLRRRRADVVESSISITDADDVATELPSISIEGLVAQQLVGRGDIVLENTNTKEPTKQCENHNGGTTNIENYYPKTLVNGRLHMPRDSVVVNSNNNQDLNNHQRNNHLYSNNNKTTNHHHHSNQNHVTSHHRRQCRHEGSHDETEALLEEVEEAEVTPLNSMEIKRKSLPCENYEKVCSEVNGTESPVEVMEMKEILPKEVGDIRKNKFVSKSDGDLKKLSQTEKNDKNDKNENCVDGNSGIEMDMPLHRNATKPKVLSNEIERRKRVRKLQKELHKIQRELEALGDLEYEVSYV